METHRPLPSGRTGPDLHEVRRLLDALETDLARVSAGSGDVQDLREEVERLRAVLDTSGDGPGPIEEGLHRILTRIERGFDVVVDEVIRDARYVTEIGRLLGL